MSIRVNPISGFLTDWVLLGPFVPPVPNKGLDDRTNPPGLDRDYLVALGGEGAAVIGPDTTVRYDAAPGKSRIARAQRIGPALDDPQRPDFAHILDGRHILEQDYDQSTAYAFCRVESPTARRMYASMGADGAVRVRVNGAVVYEAREQRKSLSLRHNLAFDLRAGANAILIKIDNRLDWWGFQIELRDSPPDASAPAAAPAVADAAGAIAAVGQRFERVAGRVAELPAAWKGLVDGVVAWIARALRDGFGAGDWRTANFVRFVDDFASALEEGRNPLASLANRALPVLHDHGGAGGEYYVFLPEGFAPERRCPLVIDLHGSNAGARRAPLEDIKLAGTSPEGPPVIAATPITHTWGWRIEDLDAFWADAGRRLSVDPDRVYLQGGSMGGKGTWDWAVARPELFAAICVKCGTDGQPFRAGRLRNVPVWAFNGEKDLASYPFMPELMISALRRMGAEARYTLFPHLSHGMGDAIDKRAIKEWYLQHKRGTGAPPVADPIDRLGIGEDGSSPMTLVDIPATQVLELTAREHVDFPHDNLFRAAVKLYQAYRKTSGPQPDCLAEGRPVVLVNASDPDGPARMVLDAPAPFDGSERGDLRLVDLPALRAARLYVRGDWNQLVLHLRALRSRLAEQGRKLTGDCRAAILPTGLKNDHRYWELLVGAE